MLPAIALEFAACSDSDDDGDDGDNGNGNGGGLGEVYTLTIKAGEITNAPSNGEIDVVKLVSFNTDAALVTTEWKDGFSLEFPETVSSSQLEKIADSFVIDDDEFEISDPSARISGFYIEGYKNDSYVDTFYYFNNIDRWKSTTITVTAT